MRPIDADALKELFSEVIGRIAIKPEMNGNLEHMIRASAMVIQMIDDAPTVNALNCSEIPNNWTPCSERLPECEQEVLICTKKKVYVSKKTGMEWYEESVITPALYEDGTMLEVDSKWRWGDIDYAGWDEEEDCGIIPEGWWENRRFNPDEVYNNPVDKEVIAWMPLPEPYQERGEQE